MDNPTTTQSLLRALSITPLLISKVFNMPVIEARSKVEGISTFGQYCARHNLDLSSYHHVLVTAFELNEEGYCVNDMKEKEESIIKTEAIQLTLL